jgi:hypothetical protein
MSVPDDVFLDLRLQFRAFLGDALISASMKAVLQLAFAIISVMIILDSHRTNFVYTHHSKDFRLFCGLEFSEFLAICISAIRLTRDFILHVFTKNIQY